VRDANVRFTRDRGYGDLVRACRKKSGGAAPTTGEGAGMALASESPDSVERAYAFGAAGA